MAQYLDFEIDSIPQPTYNERVESAYNPVYPQTCQHPAAVSKSTGLPPICLARLAYVGRISVRDDMICHSNLQYERHKGWFVTDQQNRFYGDIFRDKPSSMFSKPEGVRTLHDVPYKIESPSVVDESRYDVEFVPVDDVPIRAVVNSTPLTTRQVYQFAEEDKLEITRDRFLSNEHICIHPDKQFTVVTNADEFYGGDCDRKHVDDWLSDYRFLENHY